MNFLNVHQVANLMDISLSGAYQVISELNKELKEQGFKVKRGKVNALYFKKVYGFAEEESEFELQKNA
ncbi:helix-turn-helix domain-containing protein [Listeria valentina]|uniref:helix-turn-helix domain-containing protein n=1 Tax=Listeria valentina TaxID=2705293 RepID=UPI00142F962F|nr:helix-turn-helix domain-containing protein [Listeria valentina]